MAGSAIVARLQLDSKDYDKKLEQAKRKTKDFSQGGMSEFAKFATAIAGSKAAMEAFNRVIASSQTIGDNYARTMEVAKSVTDQFVYSIANADFTRFTDGLKGVRQRAREAYDALDQLGNTNISYSYFQGRERAAFKEGILTAKDTGLSMDERKAGLAIAKTAMTNLQGYIEKLGSDTEAYLRAEIAKIADIDISDVDADILARALAVDLNKDAAQIRADIVAKYNEYQARYAAEVTPYQSRTNANRYGYQVANFAYNPEMAAANASALNTEYAETKQLYAILNVLSDEQLKNLSQQGLAVENFKYSMGDIITQYREAEKLLNTPVNPNTVVAKLPDKGGAGGGIDFTRGLAVVGTGTTRTRTSAQIEMSNAVSEDATKRAEEYNNALATLDATAVSASDGLGMVGNMIGQLGGMMDEGTSAWMSYAGNIVSAIGGAIPSLEALAAAQAAAAVAGTALNPWTAVAAVAAIGSVVAAMSQLPKFATGGVVPGNMMSGDNVLIRANSGEVVLTKTQANNIGSMLNGGMNGKVVFEIRGDKLVGILNNYNKTKAYGVR
jgi:hypothetical protein